MLKLIKTLAFYTVYALIIGELITRFFSLTSDIPNRFIDKHHIQKYYPNQSGKWERGSHDWQTNKLGWAGPLPETFTNLITIHGDSFIENFMNPDECRQAYLLKRELSNYNFLETARSGVSFIEAMEISKQLDTLNPKYQLIYLSDNDFEESISEIARKKDIIQIDLEKNTLLYGEMKAPFIKKILYNWKFIYYLFLRFPLDFRSNTDIVNRSPKNLSNSLQHRNLYAELLEYIVRNYAIDDKILIFRPETSAELVVLAKEKGFKIIHLDNKGEKWSFDNDHHWKCYGHRMAALQVAKYLGSMQ